MIELRAGHGMTIEAEIIYQSDGCTHAKSEKRKACVACVEAGLREREQRVRAAERVCYAAEMLADHGLIAPALDDALAAWRKVRDA